MNTETVTVRPKGEDFEIIVQHNESGSSYNIILSKNAYNQLQNHFIGYIKFFKIRCTNCGVDEIISDNCCNCCGAKQINLFSHNQKNHLNYKQK